MSTFIVAAIVGVVVVAFIAGIADGVKKIRDKRSPKEIAITERYCTKHFC